MLIKTTCASDAVMGIFQTAGCGRYSIIGLRLSVKHLTMDNDTTTEPVVAPSEPVAPVEVEAE